MITIEQLEHLKMGLNACEAQASFFSPLNVLGRVAMGKWEVLCKYGVMAFVTGEAVRISPPMEKGAYYSAILEWAMTHEVQFVPAYMAQAFRDKAGFMVKKIHTEYIMDPVKLTALPGGTLRNQRYDVARAARVTETRNLWPADHLEELLKVNAIWYMEAKSRLWRPSESLHIQWLLKSWKDVVDLDPAATCIGVFDKQAGGLLSFELGTRLTDHMAASFTQRSQRVLLNGERTGVNLLCSIAMVERFNLPLNDGPADNKELAARKDRLCSSKLDFFSVARQ
jgi:hypothetical protein